MKTSDTAENGITAKWLGRGLVAAGGLALACLLLVDRTDGTADEKRTTRDDVSHRNRERPSLASKLDDIRRESDPMRREERLVIFFEQLELAQIRALLNERLLLPDAPVNDEFLRLVRHWAETDPAAAAAWVALLSRGGPRSAALEQVALAWAAEDLSDAAEWSRSLEDGEERESAMLAVGNEAVRTEPFAALALAAELPASESSDELLRRAAMEWASVDGSAAADWARTVDDQELRAHLLSGIALASSESDPVAAATLAANELRPGRPQSNLVVGIVQRWAARDPAAAADWVASFPPGPLRRDAANCLLEQWSRSAPAEAARWQTAHLPNSKKGIGN